MKKTSGFMLGVLIAITLTLGASEAFAARLGGGKSFGSRPSYSTPYNRSNTMNQAAPSQQPAYQPSAATQRNQLAREAMSRRGGLMGMLGGLALGGLLGALLFGGAFENINFMDILIFGAIAFMLFKLFASRRPSGNAQTAMGGQEFRQGDFDPSRSAEPTEPSARGQAGFNTDVLFRKEGQAAASAAPSLPADFDAQAFLTGAKAAYTHLQRAWDQGDLAELRGLSTDKVFSELQEQIRQRVGETRTELLKVEAELLEVRDSGSERVATVLFDVLMRESAGENPTPVKEVWHFVRDRFSKQPTWFLDGIQQLDA
ncbi:MAG: Tim44-like domain-containing protein [Methylococcaceae bacterium]|nr:Tim44-like domain-containing protein [Methylococcaceae bacterium]